MGNLLFVEHPNPGKKTKRWLIINHSGEQLGFIEFRPGWRKYVWGTLNHSIFDVTCTEEIVQFLKEHKDDRNSG